MSRLILTVGLPRSGKTTWARAQGHPIVNPDSIRFALHGERFLKPAEPFVWAIAQVMVGALFLAGHETVIVDATNATAKRRQEWCDRFPGADVDFHIIDVAPSVCLARAAIESDNEIIPIIESMAAKWDLPKPDSWDGPLR